MGVSVLDPADLNLEVTESEPLIVTDVLQLDLANLRPPNRAEPTA